MAFLRPKLQKRDTDTSYFTLQQFMIFHAVKCQKARLGENVLKDKQYSVWNSQHVFLAIFFPKTFIIYEFSDSSHKDPTTES